VFLHFASRVSRIIQGQWLPSSGIASSHVVSALLDVKEATVKPLVKRHAIPVYRPSDGNMFKFEDFAVRANPEEKSPDSVSPSSTGVEPEKKDAKTGRKPKGK
jgi:hypothetical protein